NNPQRLTLYWLEKPSPVIIIPKVFVRNSEGLRKTMLLVVPVFSILLNPSKFFCKKNLNVLPVLIPKLFLEVFRPLGNISSFNSLREALASKEMIEDQGSPVHAFQHLGSSK
ncbi:MAG: hypothetical protein ACOYOI_08450, partial [Chthoniobacterales bacterium]